MKLQLKAILIFLFSYAFFAHAQSVPEGETPIHETQIRGYWIDPSTGLMWAGKDNGKDVNWKKAVKYCRIYGWQDIPTGGWGHLRNYKESTTQASDLPVGLFFPARRVKIPHGM